MFRNYLATALRNLARNWLYAAISILGLSVGFAAAILVALFVVDELSYDRFIPGYQQVYRISETITPPGQPPVKSDVVQATIAAQIKLSDPGIVATARLVQAFPQVRHNPGDTPIIDQNFAWADPAIFTVMPLPVLAGDLKTALAQPDTVVITQRIARKYFGRDLPIGETVLIGPDPDFQDNDQHVMRVTAVLKDLPSNTHLTTEIYASARGAYSPLSKRDANPGPGYSLGMTYLRLAPQASLADLRHALDRAERPLEATFASFGTRAKVALDPEPLAEIHLTPAGLGSEMNKPSGSRTTIYSIATVASLILLVASINFVTLMTARAARRGVEVGVRKVAGAQRRDLIVQFIGESLIYVALSGLFAVALAELVLPGFNAFLGRTLVFHYWSDPRLLIGLIGLVTLVGLLAGAYPAFVLSAFRPATTLKSGLVQTAGSATARQALVVVQFAILIGLIVTTTTIYRQTDFALKQGLAGQSQLMVAIRADCMSAFADEVRRLPGVRGAACASPPALNFPNALSPTPVQTPGGRGVNFKPAAIDFGFFELFGIKPVAGRLFSREHGGDDVLRQADTTAQPPVVINETGVHALGFASPAAAIGRPLSWPRWQRPDLRPTPQPSEIIGVVKDLPTTVRAPTVPTFYYVAPRNTYTLAVAMTGQDMPDVLRSIERTWRATGNTNPIQEFFLKQSIRAQYLDIITQGVTISICAVLAVLIACLGLFALTAFITERRTKEIGIRKVMGATTADVMWLFLWQFTQPVLWAIAIALPVGLIVMNWWLGGFVYHVDLPAWSFVLAAVAALVIAWLTVSFQSFVVARAKPVGALRYE